METIKGYIERISFRNPQNGYTVMSVVTDSEKLTCVGSAMGFSEGETIEADGIYVDHSVYGRQFKIESIRSVAPSDRISVLRYLGSGAINGIGEKLAQRIVDKFGDDTLRIMEEEPERLSEVKGISARMARSITDQMAEKRNERSAMLFMQQYGLSQNLISKLYDRYGDGLYNIIKNNPYKMVEDVPSVGFRTADEIAVKAGIETDSEYRIRSGIIYVLQQMAYMGHCYIPEELLFENTLKLLSLSGESIREVFESQEENLAIDRQIVIRLNEQGVKNIYLGSFDAMERFCAHRLKELKDTFTPYEDHMSPAKSDEDIVLDELQEKAVKECLSNGVFILSGGPGTGKTTTINEIIRRLDEQEISFALAAPTGRAAKRMTETTGYEAQTIHRLLEISGDVESADRKLFYGRNEDNPLEVETVIIDETSMLDIYLLRALLEALEPGTQLILVGDVDQLPSVGPGQVLRDIMDSNAFATVRLNRIYRQAGESHIISYAHMINNGKHIDLSVKYPDFFLLEKEDAATVQQYLVQLCAKVLPGRNGITAGDIQILTPMRKGPLGVEHLNEILQKFLNPPSDDKIETLCGNTIFREGDRVMQIKNDYNLEWEVRGNYNISIREGKGVFNGDTGIAEEINTALRLMKVSFDDGRTVYYPFEKLEELELAYAVTIHKSQGSEYPVIIMPLLSGPPMLMNRNLLYTGVTRAKQCVIIVGSGACVMNMIDTDSEQHRYTSLKERICEL